MPGHNHDRGSRKIIKLDRTMTRALKKDVGMMLRDDNQEAPTSCILGGVHELKRKATGSGGRHIIDSAGTATLGRGLGTSLNPVLQSRRCAKEQ